MFLIRHGKPTTPAKCCLGWSDPSLVSAAQTTHTLSTALELYPQLQHIRAIHCSDLQRAHETALLLASLLGHRPDVIQDTRLREMNFGLWEEMTWPQIEADYPQQYASYMAQWETMRTPDGESWDDLNQRVRSWREQHAEKATCVVAHHGSLRALWAQSLGLDAVQAHQTRWGYAQVHNFV